MPRKRYLKPDFFLDEDLTECSPYARLLFAGLWLLADRDGRLEDRPRKIKAQTFPYEQIDVEKLLQELEPHHICRYESDEKQYIQILNFSKHQTPHPNETKSVIKPPTQADLTNSEKINTLKIDKKHESNLIVLPSNTNGCASKAITELGQEQNLDSNSNVQPRKDAAGCASGEKNKILPESAWILARKLRKLILVNDENTRVPKDLTKWADEAERLHRLDNRPESEAIKVATWALQDNFWKSNILSVDKLRKHYTKLKLQMNRKGNNKSVAKGAGAAAPDEESTASRMEQA